MMAVDVFTQYESLYQVLEQVDSHPRMFFGDNVPPVLNFLWGFNLACNTLGLTKRRDEIYEIVKQEHGWEANALHPTTQMLQQGMSSEDIIRETLELELETWRRVCSEFQEKSDGDPT